MQKLNMQISKNKINHPKSNYFDKKTFAIYKILNITLQGKTDCNVLQGTFSDLKIAFIHIILFGISSYIFS